VLLQCGCVVVAIMGLRQCILGLLVLAAFDHVYSIKAWVFQPQVLMQKPQKDDSHLREHWKPIQAPYGVQSQRPQLAPLIPNLTPSSIQSKQEFQGPVRELTWKFPVAPEETAQPDFNFEFQQPKPSNSLAVQCWEDGVHVEVKQDFFGTGQLLEPSYVPRELWCCGHRCRCQSPHLSFGASGLWWRDSCMSSGFLTELLICL